MCSKEARVQPNAGNPLGNEPGVLSRRYRAVPTATAAEEELTRLLVGGWDVAVHRLSGLFRHLEPTGWPVFFWRTVARIDRMTMGSNIFDLQPGDVTSSELAVDSQIEHSQVACSAGDLQLAADRPDMLWPERRLCADQLAFVPGFATCGLRDRIGGVLHSGGPLLQRAIRMRSSFLRPSEGGQLLKLSGRRAHSSPIGRSRIDPLLTSLAAAFKDAFERLSGSNVIGLMPDPSF